MIDLLPLQASKLSVVPPTGLLSLPNELLSRCLFGEANDVVLTEPATERLVQRWLVTPDRLAAVALETMLRKCAAIITPVTAPDLIGDSARFDWLLAETFCGRLVDKIWILTITLGIGPPINDLPSLKALAGLAEQSIARINLGIHLYRPLQTHVDQILSEAWCTKVSRLYAIEKTVNQPLVMIPPLPSVTQLTLGYFRSRQMHPTLWSQIELLSASQSVDGHCPKLKELRVFPFDASNEIHLRAPALESLKLAFHGISAIPALVATATRFPSIHTLKITKSPSRPQYYRLAPATRFLVVRGDWQPEPPYPIDFEELAPLLVALTLALECADWLGQLRILIVRFRSLSLTPGSAAEVLALYGLDAAVVQHFLEVCTKRGITLL